MRLHASAAVRALNVFECGCGWACAEDGEASGDVSVDEGGECGETAAACGANDDGGKEAASCWSWLRAVMEPVREAFDGRRAALVEAPVLMLLLRECVDGCMVAVVVVVVVARE
jgi:hypothetical protein